ncbi:hypothetical protein [Brevundimonas sp. TWP3-1-2b1]|uniref:hypothetical protein n=1 Tax=Brevundimonas sp. TWP3-1-2b1 TaxID=2804650 RepID=UPI003CE737BF
MATIVAVAALLADRGRQTVKTTIEVGPFPSRQAATTVIRLKAQQGVELAATAIGCVDLMKADRH